ncbi:MAG: serine/threonine protein kinase [Planctomycetes bacterium]|nr:serine/threonine protein kinase [Planctomycetota bacterium]
MATLLDEFTNLEVIGTGAGSTIFKGLHTGDGLVYAVKDVKWIREGDERYLRQAANEYRIGTLLDHKNLVKMYDFQRVRKYFKVVRCIVVMDYFPGVRLSPKNRFSIPDLVGVFLQVARALSYMHQMGFVHTDVKPENILVDEGADVRLVDFGVACRRASRKNRVQGTPDFIAPEQLSKKPLDARTDIYNLGTTMYKVLTGKIAPENIRMAAPLGNSAVSESLSLAKLGVRHHNAAVPEKIAYIVEKCCRRSRSKRYQSMREVERELLASLREIAPPDHRFIKEAV